MTHYVIVGQDGSAMSDLDTGAEYRFNTRDEAEVFRSLHKSGVQVVERQAPLQPQPNYNVKLRATLDRIRHRHSGSTTRAS